MPLLTEEIKAQVREALAGLTRPVRLVVFTQTLECMFCRENRELIEGVAELSDQVTAEVYNFIMDADKAQEYGVDKIPALVLMDDQDHGLRFYGIPAGFEFTSLIHVIRMVGGTGSQLDQATVKALNALTGPVHIQTFVTPTCPYCPQAVVLAYEMAYASPMVRADAIESSEFPQLAIKYEVAGVPRTVINDKVHIEGVVPVGVMVEKIQEALAGQE